MLNNKLAKPKIQRFVLTKKEKKDFLSYSIYGRFLSASKIKAPTMAIAAIMPATAGPK